MIPYKEFNVIGSRVINLQKPCKEDLEWLYITKNLKRREIGDIYNKSIGTIGTWLKNANIKKPNIKKPVKKELMGLYIEENHSIEEITVIFGVSEPIVTKWLKEYNIKKPMELIVKKREKTCFERHGVKNPSQAEEIKKKKKKTCFKNFGVEHPGQSEEVKEKARQTNLENLGVENPFQAEEIKEKIKQINKENLGVENPMQSKEVKEKHEQTCLKNLGVGNPFQAEEIKDKIKQTNLENLGVEHPGQSEEVKEKARQTNLENLGVENPNQKHIKNYNIYNDFDKFCNWVKETSINLGRELTSSDVLIFFNVGIDKGLYKLHELDNIESLQKYYKIGKSKLETITEKWIKQNTISVYEKNKYYDFMLNSNGNKMQLDFFFPKLKIAIEVNDNWSHNPEFRIYKRKMTPEEALNYEQIKTDLCEAQGIKLIHLWENDFDNIDNILKPIKDKENKLN
jgi:transposase